MFLFAYGLDPESLDAEQNKMETFKRFKESKFTVETFEENKREDLIKFLKNYKDRIRRDYNQFNSNNIDSLNQIIKKFTDYIEVNSMSWNHNVFNNVILNTLNDLMNTIQNEDLIKIDYNSIRKQTMNKINPKFILRNHVAQRAIEKAENRSYDELEKVMNVMTSPFDEHEEVDFSDYDTSIETAYNVCVSCSS